MRTDVHIAGGNQPSVKQAARAFFHSACVRSLASVPCPYRSADPPSVNSCTRAPGTDSSGTSTMASQPPGSVVARSSRLTGAWPGTPSHW
ncbi:hypothetical protein ACGFZK_25350 [Streptomyces sp. NPDC048257]|uniref:hypothetical protein n=1 Tax=Streptomyces sp. NPDC048257 TaxID=3365526 RepID=UPI00371E023A